MVRRILLSALLGAVLAAAARPAAKFDLKGLAGSWEGEGMFLMPVTDLEVEVEGEGEFVYDAKRDLVKTTMSGSKFLVPYSDSGLLRYDLATDSVSWEVWDNWGQHSMYYGQWRDGVIAADRLWKSRNYQVTVTFPHRDTLNFHLTATDPQTQLKTTRARFSLWRVK